MKEFLFSRCGAACDFADGGWTTDEEVRMQDGRSYRAGVGAVLLDLPSFVVGTPPATAAGRCAGPSMGRLGVIRDGPFAENGSGLGAEQFERQPHFPRQRFSAFVLPVGQHSLDLVD